MFIPFEMALLRAQVKKKKMNKEHDIANEDIKVGTFQAS